MFEIEYAGLTWSPPRAQAELETVGLSVPAAERLTAQMEAGQALGLVARNRSGLVALAALRDWGPSPQMREAMIAAAPTERWSVHIGAAVCLCWSIAHALIGLEQVVIMRRRDDLAAQDALRRLRPGARERGGGPAWVLLLDATPRHYREPDPEATRALKDLIDASPCVAAWRAITAKPDPQPSRAGGAAGIAGVLEDVRRRTATLNVPAGVHVPVAPSRTSAPARQVGESEVVLTAEGLADLQAEHQRLIGARRAEVAERLKTAREMGSVADDGEYEDAIREQQALEAEIIRAEERLARARIAETSRDGRAGIGSRLKVREGDSEREYLLVGALEADPKAGRISIEAPLGLALRGSRAGDLTALDAPKGRRRIEILAVS